MTGDRIGARIERATRKEATIFESVSSSPLDDRYETGATPGEGTFFCVVCGSQLSMEETDELPACGGCGGYQFRRDSIFEAHQDHGQTTSELRMPVPSREPSWLQEARERLTQSDTCLAFADDDDAIQIHPIERGWTRVGRSPNADLRLDDPSVSRRHALIVAEPGKPLRILDDRSLNGILLNGETVEWGPLRDGDRLAIGRYDLYVLQP